jgi:hypothetical protein
MREMPAELRGFRLFVLFPFLVLGAGFLLAFQNCAKFTPNKSMGFQELTSKSGAPKIEVSSALPLVSGSNDVSMTFSVSMANDFTLTSATCQLDTSPTFDCMNGNVSLTDVSDGDHKLTVQLVDSGGNEFNKLYVFKVDTTAPEIVLNSKPAATTSATSATFSFSSMDTVSAVSKPTCTLDGVSSACASPLKLTALAYGNHELKIQIEDAAHNSNEVSYSWSIVPSAPTITLTMKPLSVAKSANASFTFVATQDGKSLSGFQCQLDGDPAAACTGTFSKQGMSGGNHRFTVTVTGLDGTISAPLTYDWMIDLGQPTTPVITASVTTATQSPDANFVFTSTDGSGIQSYSCSLDGADFATCVSPLELKALEEGSHNLRVRAKDNTNMDSALGVFVWSIDLAGPSQYMFIKPSATSDASNAMFYFRITEENLGAAPFTCQLDEQPIETNCANPKYYSGLSAGSHVFRFVGTDLAGNKTESKYSWTTTATTLATFQTTPKNCGDYGVTVNQCHFTIPETRTGTLESFPNETPGYTGQYYSSCSMAGYLGGGNSTCKVDTAPAETPPAQTNCQSLSPSTGYLSFYKSDYDDDKIWFSFETEDDDRTYPDKWYASTGVVQVSFSPEYDPKLPVTSANGWASFEFSLQDSRIGAGKPRVPIYLHIPEIDSCGNIVKWKSSVASALLN